MGLLAVLERENKRVYDDALAAHEAAILVWETEKRKLMREGELRERDAFENALSKWVEALALAAGKRRAYGEQLGPPPIWAFWMLFSRRGDPESPLSALLHGEVGYPSGDRARVLAGGAE